MSFSWGSYVTVASAIFLTPFLARTLPRCSINGTLAQMLLLAGPKASSCKGCKSKNDSTVGQDLAKTWEGRKQRPLLNLPETNVAPENQ